MERQGGGLPSFTFQVVDEGIDMGVEGYLSRGVISGVIRLGRYVYVYIGSGGVPSLMNELLYPLEPRPLP